MDQGTTWGISAQESSSFTSIPFVETDFWNLTKHSSTCKITVRFSHWFLSAPEEVEHEERVQNLLETLALKQVLAGVVNVSARTLDDPSSMGRIESLFKQTNDRNISLYFDFGRYGNPNWIDPGSCVFDPLWFNEKPSSCYWKIHGWHSERWVRQYSEQELVRLVDLASKFAPRFIVLAHSQRIAQWQWIQSHVPLSGL